MKSSDTPPPVGCQSTPGLLKLPTELRLQVLGYHLSTQIPRDEPTNTYMGWAHWWRPLPIMRVCSVLRKEAIMLHLKLDFEHCIKEFDISDIREHRI